MIIFPTYITYIGKEDVSIYLKYGYYTDYDTFAFFDDLSNPDITPSIHFTEGRYYVWKLPFMTSKELLSHPDILCFTKESHPEMFI